MIGIFFHNLSSWKYIMGVLVLSFGTRSTWNLAPGALSPLSIPLSFNPFTPQIKITVTGPVHGAAMRGFFVLVQRA